MADLSRYLYDKNLPLCKPYTERGVYNAYFKGRDTIKNRNVLISEFKQTSLNRMRNKAQRLLALKQIQHENLAKIYDVIIDEDNKIMIVALQWCEGGSIYDYQKNQNTLGIDLVVKIIRQVSAPLAVIHGAGLIYRFMNMENIQFTSQGKLKLTFKCLYPKAIYLSPAEKKGARTIQNDIFSLGILMYKLLYSTVPFKGNSLNEQLENVKQGVKFPQQKQEMFPIVVPQRVKQLICLMAAENPIKIEQVLKQLTAYESNERYYNYKQLQEITLKKKFNKYIPVCICRRSSEQEIFLALDPSRKRIFKLHFLKGNSLKLKSYDSQMLADFKGNGVLGFKLIEETYFPDKEHLVIVSNYDNQGPLTQYLLVKRKSIQINNSKFTDQILDRIKLYGKQYNYLTTQSIVIRKGQFYINYPPLDRKMYLEMVEENELDREMIAPEIRKGETREDADQWSIGMLKYYLDESQLPKFDNEGKVVIPGRHRKSQQQIQFYQKCLKKHQKSKLIAFPGYIEQQLEIPEGKISNKKKLQALRHKIKQHKDKDKGQDQEVPVENKRTCGEIISEKLLIFQPLEKHWTKPIRIGIKIVLGLIYLIFLFYFSFFVINGQLIAEHSLYSAQPVEIRALSTDSAPRINYTLVTKTPADTATLFYNETLIVLRDERRCVLNDYSVQTNVVQVINRSQFTAYQIFGIILSIINLIIFCLKLSKMDFPKAYFISNIEENDYEPIFNWLLLNLCMVTQISFIYLLYGSLFHMQLEPCLTKATLTAVQYLLKDWQFMFAIRFSWIYIGLILTYILSIFLLIRPTQKIHKVVKLVFILLYLTGAFSRIMGQSGDYVAYEKQSVFGKVGELLGLIIGVTCLMIDILFGCFIKSEDEKKKSQVEDQYQSQLNITEENFLED